MLRVELRSVTMAGGYLSVGTDGMLLMLMSRVGNLATSVGYYYALDIKGQQTTPGCGRLIVRDKKRC